MLLTDRHSKIEYHDTMKRLIVILLVGVGIHMQAKCEDRWAVATGDDNGKPVIYRYIVKPPKGIKTREYPNLIAISWSYHGSEQNGMPDPKTNERMVLLEKLLETKLEGSRNACLTVIATGNGHKEWQWYSRNVQETLRLLNEALSGREVFPIQISDQDDQQWSAYYSIVNAAR